MSARLDEDSQSLLCSQGQSVIYAQTDRTTAALLYPFGNALRWDK